MAKQKAEYNRRSSLRRLEDLLTSCFERPQLLTLCYRPGPPIPRAYEDSEYRTFMYLARRLAGGPFRYVKTTKSGADPSAPAIMHRLVVDLPADTCRKIAARWGMGAATVEALDTRQLAAFAAEVMGAPQYNREKGRKAWDTSVGLSQQRVRNCAQI